ncbi:hypothetical protein LY78DRAFT_595115, partial [Colletotrichum sublineola]
KTYNARYSLVVTDPTTNPALTGLSTGERTGSRVLQWVWSYVIDTETWADNKGSTLGCATLTSLGKLIPQAPQLKRLREHLTSIHHNLKSKYKIRTSQIGRKQSRSRPTLGAHNLAKVELMTRSRMLTPSSRAGTWAS